MSSLIKHAAAVCIAVIVATASPAVAQSTGTTVEFKAATRLPGITLEPGKYVFRVGEHVGRQTVVEIYSSDGSRKIATLLTADYGAPAPANATMVMFEGAERPTLRAWYAPGSTIGREFLYDEEEARTIGRMARSIGDAAKDVAKDAARVVASVATDVTDVAANVGDDIADNATLVNPTETRVAAERHLDAAEKAYNDLEDRVSRDVETRLQPLGSTLEALEDAFEKGQSWMGHYTAAIASLDALSPERPVGTSGGSATLDASTQAALMVIRGHLRAFHAQAMK